MITILSLEIVVLDASSNQALLSVELQLVFAMLLKNVLDLAVHALLMSNLPLYAVLLLDLVILQKLALVLVLTVLAILTVPTSVLAMIQILVPIQALVIMEVIWINY